jgi:hypothetical protein
MPTALHENPSATIPIPPPHQTSTHENLHKNSPKPQLLVTSSLLKRRRRQKKTTPHRPTTQTPQHTTENTRSGPTSPSPQHPKETQPKTSGSKPPATKTADHHPANTRKRTSNHPNPDKQTCETPKPSESTMEKIWQPETKRRRVTVVRRWEPHRTTTAAIYIWTDEGLDIGVKQRRRLKLF